MLSPEKRRACVILGRREMVKLAAAAARYPAGRTWTLVDSAAGRPDGRRGDSCEERVLLFSPGDLRRRMGCGGRAVGLGTVFLPGGEQAAGRDEQRFRHDSTRSGVLMRSDSRSAVHAGGGRRPERLALGILVDPPARWFADRGAGSCNRTQPVAG